MTIFATERRPTAAVIGAGPAGLMAAEGLAAAGVTVTIYDRMASPGRKLLLAGRGGLNLTHSEDAAAFRARYGRAEGHIAPALAAFDPSALRAWCEDLGIETFVGTSGRVFPASFKTSPLLRAWLRRLDAAGVRFALRHHWRGWTPDGTLRFEAPDGPRAIQADATVLALGGSSWPQLGSDGGWVGALNVAGVAVEPLQPANCGFALPWSDWFRDTFEGTPLKSIALHIAGATARGDVVVTRAGLEGGAIYALAAPLREAIAGGKADLRLALRPDLSHETLVGKLAKRGPKDSLSNALRKTLGLTPVAIALLREAGDLAALDADGLARRVNAVPLRPAGPMPIARAISTAGGVRFDACDAALMLRARPGTFVAGEMLDWEAPTGGYLLQACFATGCLAAKGTLAWLQEEPKVEADADPLAVV